MPLTVSRKADRLDATLSSGLLPEQADGFAREVALVGALRELGDATAAAPDEEFRSALRTRLLAVAAVQGVGETATAPAPAPAPWRRRAATVTAGAMASVVAVTGVSVAASRSLPGDPFYGLKRTTEGVQLRLAGGEEQEGTRHLQFAAERLGELRRMADGGALSSDDLARVESLLDDMDDDTRSGQRLLVDAFRATQDAAPLERLSRFADDQRDGLQELILVLPQEVRPRARESLVLVGDVSTIAGELLLLRDCTAVCDPDATAPVLGDPAAPGACECPAPPPPPAVAPPPPAPVDEVPGAPAPDAPAPPPAPGDTGEPAPPPAPPPPGPSLPGVPTVPGVPLPTAPLPDPGLPLPGEPLPTLPGLDLDDPPLIGDGSVTDPLTDPLTGGGLVGVAPLSPSLAGIAFAALRSWWGSR
jgi:hypothetical protein